MRGCRCGTRPAETILAFGVDRRVLGASRMSRKLVEEAAAECGGVVLQGFADIRAALQMFAEPYAMQQAFAQRSQPGPAAAEPHGVGGAEAALHAACGDADADDKGGAPRCPRRGLEHGAPLVLCEGHAGQSCVRPTQGCVRGVPGAGDSSPARHACSL